MLVHCSSVLMGVGVGRYSQGARKKKQELRWLRCDALVCKPIAIFSVRSMRVKQSSMMMTTTALGSANFQYSKLLLMLVPKLTAAAAAAAEFARCLPCLWRLESAPQMPLKRIPNLLAPLAILVG